jgi:GDP-4-dehydro-6-deoxy-D-mannose reductase
MTGPILVTGAGGFVGGYLLAELGPAAVSSLADVTDPAALAEEVAAVAPEAIVHLAALSSVAGSWRAGAEVWRVNAIGTVNVLDVAATERPSARVLVVSTGEVYGRAEVFPTPEDAPMRPISPYAASKAAAEIACERARLSDRLDVVVTRPFLHVGPGQEERFALGSWTRQIARLEAEGGGVLEAGDLSVERDLTDVRDVVRAYRLLLDRSVETGTYNVATGRTVRLAEVVDALVSLTDCEVRVTLDERRARPADIPKLCGDPRRLTEATGWRPVIPLEQTLADTLQAARESLVGEGTART